MCTHVRAPVCVRPCACARVHAHTPEPRSTELQETLLGCGVGVSGGDHASEKNIKESFQITGHTSHLPA